MEDDWSFEAVRPCRACGASGKPPERPAVPGGDYSNFMRPAECPTCIGTKEERKRFTFAELKDLFAR